eukprot:TRINITY_DN5502_c0_g1_i1.p1 TRINITY_DN5502_c0_g1~~TRINITY_DN5502_c0_g1_i1.p1  ORF type:complete len:459 (-),score=121.34 TRINITY_DN5502_c0_g1_i1:82-1458(-)
MKSGFVLFLVLSLFVIFSVSDQGSTESDVIVLTEENFNDQIAQGGQWFVEFYAPWCGHCKKLAPIYEQVATKLKGNTHVAKVDCTVQKDLCSSFGVRGYPTIKFISNNEIRDYQSARSLDSFVSFAEGEYQKVTASPLNGFKTSRPPTPVNANDESNPTQTGTKAKSDVVELTDASFYQHTGKGDWLLEFFAPWCGHCKALAPIYEEVATALKGKVNVGKIDCTIHTGICEKYEIKGFPTIKLHKNSQIYPFENARTKESLVDFALNPQTTPSPLPAPSATPNAPHPNANKVTDSDVIPLREEMSALINNGEWLVEFFAPWCGHCKKLAPTYEKVATALKGKVSVANVDCTVERNLCSTFHISGYPTILFFKDEQVYEYSGDRSQESFVDFVNEGYKKAKASDPKNVQTQTLMEALKEVFQENIILIAGGFLGGILLLGVLLFITTRISKQTVEAKKE